MTGYIYKQAFVNKEMGYAAAISMALFAVILVVSAVQQHVCQVFADFSAAVDYDVPVGIDRIGVTLPHIDRQHAVIQSHDKALKAFLDYVGQATLLAHNADFDYRILDAQTGTVLVTGHTQNVYTSRETGHIERLTDKYWSILKRAMEQEKKQGALSTSAAPQGKGEA